MENQIALYNNILNRIQKVITFLMAAKPESTTLEQLDLRNQTCVKAESEILTAKRELLELCETAEHRELVENFLEEFYDVYDKAMDLILSVSRLIKEHQKANGLTTTQPCSTSNTISDIVLPRIEIEKFNGEVHKFISFWDLFSSTIDSKPSLTKAQKLWYLKSLLTGEAASLLRHLKPEETNYAEAKEILENRYKKPDVIARYYIDQFLNQPSFSSSSPTSLKRLHSVSDEAVRGLKALKKENRDIWLIHILLGKVDMETRRWWFDYEQDLETASISDFLHFIQYRFEKLESAASMSSPLSSSTPVQSSSVKPKAKPNGYPVKRSSFASINPSSESSKQSCSICKQARHSPFYCVALTSLSTNARIDLASKLGLCHNCLRLKHGNECEYGTCRTCKSNKHHTLLHMEQSQAAPPSVTATSLIHSAPSESNVSTPKIQIGNAMLATALVNIFDQHGKSFLCRVFLDNGSQSSFITTDLCNQLGLRKYNIDVPLTGIHGTTSKVSYASIIRIASRHTDFSTTLTCGVLKKITNQLPTKPIDRSALCIPPNLPLADPQFHVPGQIQLLIGGDLYYDLLYPQIISLGSGLPHMKNTKLGWVVAGNNISEVRSVCSTEVSCNIVSVSLDKSIQRFWEIEELPPLKKPMTKEEAECEAHYDQHTTRNANGRIVVKLDFRDNLANIGESKNIAAKRFGYLENRFSKKPELAKDYIEFMEEYKNLGHMELIDPPAPHTTPIYIPHHCVIKESSSTTKTRVVFDASAKTSTGISLNETLKVGPVVQDNLLHILLRFRKHNIAFTADVEKMYRQILVHPDDQKLIRILWRSEQTEPVREYALKTVTYGTASAPYLATKSLQYLASLNRHQFPRAAKILEEDFYVDDCLTGTSDITDAKRLYHELISLMQNGCFNLRKFSSNSQELLNEIPLENLECVQTLELDPDSAIKALGVKWKPATDNLIYSVKLDPVPSVITKRSILSQIAKLFDPFGLLAPVIITAKIMMQILWKEKLGWDVEVPDKIKNQWLQYLHNLNTVNHIEVPRRIISIDTPVKIVLDGFCDASEAAYGAMVYVRAFDHCTTSSHLLCAKSKVAPLKNVSLPRLELMGALYLAKLLREVQTALKLPIHRVTAYTDSTIVLAWIAGESWRWTTFVSNRTAQIQELLPATNWHHVSTHNNPADLLSRGVLPDTLINSKLWWHGPDWTPLELDRAQHSESIALSEADEQVIESETKRVSATFPVIRNEMLDSLITSCSSLSKLIVVTSYILRFVSNARKQPQDRTIGNTTSVERHNASHLLVRHVQTSHYNDVISSLTRGRNIPNNMRRLAPFVDGDILRVGGRLHHSNIEHNTKHPILLPSHHHLTKLIVEKEHLDLLHIGPEGLLAAIRRRYWIVGGRNLARNVVWKCLTCFRAKPTPSSTSEGQLPIERVTPSLPFTVTGIDFGGPIMTSTRQGRGQSLRKSYICLFVCFSTKAIHLEAVSDLSTDAFLAALRRFIARRGICSQIWSDNATNFHGARRKLNDFQRHFARKANFAPISNLLAENGIKWNFIPPHSPHFGGLWEAAIKSTKHHLRRVIGNACLTFEEFGTLLAQIEACLNSRPLTTSSSDPNDLQPLTPAHFLIGKPLTALPEPNLIGENFTYLARWKRIQQLTQLFWKRWQNEYLTHLQQKASHNPTINPIQIGDLVVIMEDNLPALQWPMARVTHINPGVDGQVRVATLKTYRGTTERVVKKLCRLPIN